MRRCGAGLMAAVLALAGCKSVTGPKTPDKDAPGAAAARPRDKAPPWLHQDLAKGHGVPKAESWADPKDPNFNVASEVKGVLGGRVVDPAGRGGRDVYIRIELADATPAEREKGGAPVGIMTDSNGYFQAKGLKPSRAYSLTAEAKLDGKPLYASLQTRTPNATLALQLRDDIAVPPPASVEPGAALPPDNTLPPPADLLPPMGVPVVPPVARSTDGAWSPGGTPAVRPAPHSFAAPTPTPTLPAPAELTPRPVTKPENVADGPRDPFRAPPASIPNPVPVPTIPALPPSVVPPPPPDPKRSAAPVRDGANFALRDSQGRPWDFATNRGEALTLLDFMTSTCIPCKKAVPVLTDLQERYGATGLDVIGVVCDPVPLPQRVALADKYRREFNLNYEMFTEDASQQGRLFERFADAGTGYPFVVLLDAGGNELWKGNPANRGPLEAAIKQHINK